MERRAYKIIALDLDGTLLSDGDRISPENRAALFKAHQHGALIVPTTGRLYGTMPQEVCELQELRYVIEANGAQIYDIKEKRPIHKALIEIEDAMAIYDWLDSIDCMYDCYLDGKAYVSRAFYEKADIYCRAGYGASFFQKTRTPVEDFRAFIRQNGVPLQKISVFFKDVPSKYPIIEQLREKFPKTAVSTSVPNNIEINSMLATKGQALKILCHHCQIAIEDSIAFGDAINDMDMLTCAGMGVAMANSLPPVLEIARYVTLSNNDSGVAAALNELMLW